MKTGMIYVATNLKNNKKYVGLTTQELEERISDHYYSANYQKHMGYNTHFAGALRKYDKKDWDWKIIEKNIPNEELDDKETYYIAEYRKHYNLYNMTDGGRTGYKVVKRGIITNPILLGDHVFDIIDEREPNNNEEVGELLDVMMKVIDECLTDRQWSVIKLVLAGFTQCEIAEQLGIHQTSVHKCLKGNIFYDKGGKRYGGALSKIKKNCEKNPKFTALYQKVMKSS